MAHKLSEGAIKTIMTGGTVTDPVFQILGSKVISGQGSANERYRLLISDGVHLNSFAMLATQLNPMLTSGELVENTIVKVTNHIVSVIKNQEKGDKRIMVILAVEVLQHGSKVGMRIGNPVQLTETQQQSNNENTAVSTSINTKPSMQNKMPPPVTPSRFSSNDSTVYNSPSNVIAQTHPIASLSPYQNGWVIKARVTTKSAIRTWSNARGEGKLFSITLVDESGEIRATGFNEQVDKFYEMIEESKVYFVSKCQIKMANKKFCSLNNDYEMTFTNDTRVVPCLEDDRTIPTLQFNFVKLSSIQESEPETILDFIGVCKSAGDVVTLTSKTTNRELKKREVTVVDSSLASVTLTLWGSQAEEFNGDNQPIVAVKGGKISEFQGGKSVSLIGDSVLQINPDIPEAHRLRGWFDGLSEDAKFISISSRSDTGGAAPGKNLTLKEAVDQKLGCGDKADYFNCYANVMHIRTEKCTYKACPTPECNKKVIDQNTGQYRCEKCNREYDSFKYRLMLQINIGDFSGNQWVSLFQDSAEELLEAKADDIGRWQEEDNSSFNQVFKKVTLRPYQFRLRAKMETFNDESRVKYTVFSVKKPNYKERCRQLSTEIRELSMG
ncbi:hypothetical protein O3M35_012375 [Rhynocoris fuscipes]|uniref:Replication protein A subunit n=1 Tax=Rhynocoris fuscipes TaxID=488301 RepID=A0AAW1CZI2_9HEMI